jgi:hypothetical protein
MNIHHLHHEEDEDACIVTVSGKIASVLANSVSLNRPNLRRLRVLWNGVVLCIGGRSLLNLDMLRFLPSAIFKSSFHFHVFPPLLPCLIIS